MKKLSESTNQMGDVMDGTKKYNKQMTTASNHRPLILFILVLLVVLLHDSNTEFLLEWFDWQKTTFCGMMMMIAPPPVRWCLCKYYIPTLIVGINSTQRFRLWNRKRVARRGTFLPHQMWSHLGARIERRPQQCVPPVYHVVRGNIGYRYNIETARVR